MQIAGRPAADVTSVFLNSPCYPSRDRFVPQAFLRSATTKCNEPLRSAPRQARADPQAKRPTRRKSGGARGDGDRPSDSEGASSGAGFAFEEGESDIDAQEGLEQERRFLIS